MRRRPPIRLELFPRSRWQQIPPWHRPAVFLWLRRVERKVWREWARTHGIAKKAAHE